MRTLLFVMPFLIAAWAASATEPNTRLAHIGLELDGSGAFIQQVIAGSEAVGADRRRARGIAKDVSQEVGFYDQRYLGVVFRRFTGRTPFEYRRQNVESDGVCSKRKSKLLRTHSTQRTGLAGGLRRMYHAEN
jgi:AraC-like DNA-binding protein